jgi:hypothetical protein
MDVPERGRISGCNINYFLRMQGRGANIEPYPGMAALVKD